MVLSVLANVFSSGFRMVGITRGFPIPMAGIAIASPGMSCIAIVETASVTNGNNQSPIHPECGTVDSPRPVAGLGGCEKGRKGRARLGV